MNSHEVETIDGKATILPSILSLQKMVGSVSKGFLRIRREAPEVSVDSRDLLQATAFQAGSGSNRQSMGCEQQSHSILVIGRLTTFIMK